LAPSSPCSSAGSTYERWDPTGKPVWERRVDGFLAWIAQQSPDRGLVDPEVIARAVFRMLSRRVSDGEIERRQGRLAGRDPRAVAVSDRFTLLAGTANSGSSRGGRSLTFVPGDERWQPFGELRTPNSRHGTGQTVDSLRTRSEPEPR